MFQRHQSNQIQTTFSFFSNPFLKSLGMSALALSLVFGIGCTKKNKEVSTGLNFTFNANLKGLDPSVSDVYVSRVLGQVMEPLFGYHYLKRPLELIPVVAAEMPTASKDGLTHTIKLKKGVMFHDDPAFPEGKGRELVAEDFIYGWKRIADPANRSDGFWVFEGKIKGLDAWRKAKTEGKADYDTPVEGLSAPDKHTLVVKLKKPFYQLYYVMTMTYTFPMAREVVEKYGAEIVNHPVGTGPYKLKEWVRNNKVVLEKNTNYREEVYPSEGETGDKEKGYLADAGKKIPFAESITFFELPEDQPRWLNFLKGNIDFAGVPKDNFDGAVKGDSISDELKAKGIGMTVVLDPDLTYTSFNMEDPIVGKNKNLRLAIAHAYNQAVSLERFYNGRAIVAQSPIAPGVDGYDPDYKNPNLTYDLEKAKEYMKKAGYPGGKGLPTLQFDSTNSSTARQMAEMFQQEMKKIGIKININAGTWPTFITRIREKKVQIFSMGWVGDYPDAENFLQLAYGPNSSPGPNGSNYNNPKFNEIYKKASLLPPGPERKKLYFQMRGILADDLPLRPHLHRKSYYFAHGWLRNAKRHAMIYDYGKYMRVDKDVKAETLDKL